MNEVRFKVSKDTKINKLAGAIAHTVANQKETEIKVVSIGVETLSTAVKSIAAANNMLREQGISIASTPTFEMIDIDRGRQITAITQYIKTI